MLSFYRTAAQFLLLLVTIVILLIWAGVTFSKINRPLLPKDISTIPWTTGIEPKTADDETVLTLKEEEKVISYDFFLSPNQEYPYTSYSFNFADTTHPKSLANLTAFDIVTFKIRCNPRNIMLFVLFTYDDKTTDIIDTATYRINSTFFTCDTTWRTVVIQLNNLDTPDWWLQNSGLELVDREYKLDKVISFGFVNSLQSPRDKTSSIEVSDVTIIGENKRYLYCSIIISLIISMLYFFWFFKRYIRELVTQVKEKMKSDRPLIAYQKLSIEPQKDKEKATLLRYLATEYSNPEISTETTATKLGINRHKINEILKEELDLTFSAYINKLRLTESARLLTEQDGLSISQIAYNVGFNNVTYFNKLFKSEYGCTPKMFENNYSADDTVEPPEQSD